MHQGGFAVLDFGSQLTQLIARRLRELEVYSELMPYNVSLEKLKAMRPKGIILSGGPSSVNEIDAPTRDLAALQEIAPIFGICYGMQLLSKNLGGIVKRDPVAEYGFQKIIWQETFSKSLPREQVVWMSHGDSVVTPPPGCQIVARSESGLPSAIKGDRVWAVQFHPEVSHTERGLDILRAFVFEQCGAVPNWSAPQIADRLLEQIRSQVPKGEKVLCALSGGVDLTVVATLLTKALGANNVHCVFVNNGLLRQNEFEGVLESYKKLGLHVLGVNAEQQFLAALKGVEDPEIKRKTIGRLFIEVFEQAISGLGEPIQWLAQGTLYPDVIESVSPRGASVTIKSHHNVGGLPERLRLKLVEPLRELFKDEVRALGLQLGLPREMLWRHPFPGPGLAIRIISDVTPEKLQMVREADRIFIQELRDAGLYDKIWQAFTALLPVRSVGVQGDARTYEWTIALRAVTSHDGMTADWYPFEFEFLRRVSNRITNEVKGINRVVYDVTSKPPGTIEWE